MMSIGTDLHKGLIVLAHIPFTDVDGEKARPALVMSAPNRFGEILCCPLTSNLNTPGVAVGSMDVLASNLDRTSIIVASKVLTIPRKSVLRILDEVKTPIYAQVIYDFLKQVLA